MRPVNGQVLLVASGKCEGRKSDRNKGSSGGEECWKRCGLTAPSEGAQAVSSGPTAATCQDHIPEAAGYQLNRKVHSSCLHKK